MSHDVAKDAIWNRGLLADQITQGVMLGESIPKIAARVARVTGQNVAGAARVARTSVTAAECAGRVDSYARAKSMGIDLKQEWLATLDTRTRRSHRKLDGEKVDVGSTFSNGCRYPGDPQAPYGEICNCRCTLIAAVEGVDYSDGKRWSRLPGGMTYDDWKAGKDLDEAEWTKGGKGKAGKKGGTAGSNGKAARKKKASSTASTRQSGAISGALNDANDPWGKRRQAHADRYYEEVRARDLEREIEAVVSSSGKSREKVRAAYEHVFIKEHDLEGGRRRFDPDYDMAQSWQRLREGKTVLEHDLTLIEHEAREAMYMDEGMTYAEAHAKTCSEGYNYVKDLDKWKDDDAQ